MGYVPGTISELALQRMINKYDLDRALIKTATLRPTELIPALKRGGIDAFVAWEPLPLLARRDIEGVRSFVDRTLYKASLHLVTRPEVILKKGTALERFLQALQLAENRIESDPDSARRLVEDALDFRSDALKGVWGDLQFMVKLDAPSLIESLEDEGRWVLEAGYAKGSLPDYAPYVDETVIAGFARRFRRK